MIGGFIFRVYRIIGRTIISLSKNPRPSSYPYITGDGFRNFSNHIYDKTNRHIDADKVKENDIIFVGDQLINEFLEKIHPQINSRYKLITHNGDSFIDDELVSLAGDKVIKWYGINVLTKDPKVVPIPIGISNKHYYVTGIPSIFKKVAKKNYVKRNLIFYRFTVSTNPSERQPAVDILKNNPLAHTVKNWPYFSAYLRLLATYKFVVSPPGTSVEGHRTWEALYVGVIPIVKSSITTNYFKSLNIPVWQVNDWSELNSINESVLKETYEKMKNGFNTDVLFLDYWTNKIKNTEN